MPAGLVLVHCRRKLGDPGGLFVALAALAGYFLVFVACLVDSFVGEIAERFADFLTRAGRYQGSDSGTQYQTADECCDTSCIFIIVKF